jgi:hypothetical protein
LAQWGPEESTQPDGHSGHEPVNQSPDAMVDRLHDHYSCFDKLSMRMKSSWHLPKEQLHPEPVEG